MTPEWQPLRDELSRWSDTGLELPFWWRDDDVIEPTPELDHLAILSAEAEVPVHMAVIPAHARRPLATYFRRHPFLIPVVHGFSHVNHAPPEFKKSEFGDNRSTTSATRDLRMGLAQMQSIFGGLLSPMFVPPWNRIGLETMNRLGPFGYRALSTFTPRTARNAAPGVLQVNTHIDPIDWRGTRSCLPVEALVTQTVALLQDRREGRSDAEEPLGLLTHHLAHDSAIWGFTEQFLTVMTAGPVKLWRAETLQEMAT